MFLKHEPQIARVSEISVPCALILDECDRRKKGKQFSTKRESGKEPDEERRQRKRVREGAEGDESDEGDLSDGDVLGDSDVLGKPLVLRLYSGLGVLAKAAQNVRSALTCGGLA